MCIIQAEIATLKQIEWSSCKCLLSKHQQMHSAAGQASSHSGCALANSLLPRALAMPLATCQGISDAAHTQKVKSGVEQTPAGGTRPSNGQYKLRSLERHNTHARPNPEFTDTYISKETLRATVLPP
jgi:hypothetical protein